MTCGTVFGWEYLGGNLETLVRNLQGNMEDTYGIRAGIRTEVEEEISAGIQDNDGGEESSTKQRNETDSNDDE